MLARTTRRLIASRGASCYHRFIKAGSRVVPLVEEVSLESLILVEKGIRTV